MPFSDHCQLVPSIMSAVAQWLAHWPLALDVPDSIPAGGEENLVSEKASLRVICRGDMNQCAVLPIVNCAETVIPYAG